MTDQIAERLWQNFEWYTKLSYVMRSGFIFCKMYPEPKRSEVIYRPESVAEHSGRVANLMSDIVAMCPHYFTGHDTFAITKVAMLHDIAERVLGDIPDDGCKEHDDKATREEEIVRRYLSNYPSPFSDTVLSYYRQFEEMDTYLGQFLKMVDKIDAIGRLLFFEKMGIFGDVYSKEPPSEQDVRFAEKIGTGNCTDVWARHLYWLMYEEYNFHPDIKAFAKNFLRAGVESIEGRSWFNFWE